ncbi:MAG: hypothetical protein MK101_02455 [Phycisphaerales bacterium]|nr:hypothetical protein [Phycisphaerales bacterium]
MLRPGDLRAARGVEPFRPFLLRLTDGRAISVPHPEFLSVSPTGRTCVVWKTDGTQHILSVSLITSIDFVAA